MKNRIALKRRKTPAELEAESAGLKYAQVSDPGYLRKKHGKSFRYLDPKGKTVTCPKLKKRFRSLVIPPAWQDVWIAQDASAHIQVTGRDQKGRKQYRYHPSWRTQRDSSKFEKMLSFADALPRIRDRIQADIKGPALSKQQVMATIVHLLEKTLIRIGNESYVKQNASYGLTTIRDDHVEIEKSKIKFEFKGKSGVQHLVELKDPRLARIISRCQDLPGQVLFQYLGDDGEPHPVGSSDVNLFLKEISGQDFSAKDFRTWIASVLAARVLKEFEPPKSQASGKRNVKAAITEVATALRNTVSVCRKCYVHPQIIQAYLDGLLYSECAKKYARRMKTHMAAGLNEDEAFLLALLKGCQTSKMPKAA